jgi:predicted RNA-binding Zn-ribbon protein involved in translation (DUF1610 family)
MSYTAQQHIESIAKTGLNCHGFKPVSVTMESVAAKHESMNNEPKIDDDGYTCCPWCGSYNLIDSGVDTGRCYQVEYECEDCDWEYNGIG